MSESPADAIADDSVSTDVMNPPTDAPAGGDASADATEAADGAGGRSRVAVERLEREGEIAADYLETLLDLTDLDGDLDVDIDGDRAAVSIVDSEEGRVPRRLVGRDGEVLEALQELTRLAILASTGERSRLMLDIAGFRAARRDALILRANEVVAEVKANGVKVSMEPMTPFERKVVHDAVAAAGLTTESDGVEPDRHVVVFPA